MASTSGRNKQNDMNVTHDFNSENKVVLVLCGYILLKKPLTHFIFNIILIASQFSLYAFLMVMAIYTMSITLDNKITLMQAFHSFWLLLLVLAQRTLKSFTARSLKEGSRMLNEGIFDYPDEEQDESHYSIKRKRVEQIRFAISSCTKLLITSAWVNTFLFPLVKWLTITEDTSKMAINPYLPVPFYMPFDTRTYFGYSLALLFNGGFFFSMFMSVICLEVTYISFSMQLIAQIEVLNFSLENIEKRAMNKFAKTYYFKDGIPMAYLYKKKEFQKCLYSCLRENILHHQAILRFKKAVALYLEAMNGFGIAFFSIIMATSIFLILEEPSTHMGILICSEITSCFLANLVGEMIIQKSSETAFSLYSTPWPHCNQNFKLIMKIMASYLKKPIVLRATGFNCVSSLTTFADMMSSGYKIVNVLR